MTATPTTARRRIEGPYPKAERMEAQGYTLATIRDEQGQAVPYCYRVTRPGSRAIKDVTGDEVTGYWVCIHPSRLSCDCAYFGQNGGRHRCKHILFCLLMARRWASMLAPLVDLSGVLSEIGETL